MGFDHSYSWEVPSQDRGRLCDLEGIFSLNLGDLYVSRFVFVYCDAL
jgi:hypothetical protein